MPRDQAVCAVVVTFHPTAEHLQNLAKVRAQVEFLVVVDNGSAEKQLAGLRSASQEMLFVLIENEQNLGIAIALNRGVREAQQRDFRWVALFDQDSTITAGFIATMMGEFAAYSRDKRIMQLVPRYRDPNTGIERPISHFEDGGAFLTITSGSLFAVEVFEHCGLFQENLFIYCVDDDYSLRIRDNGFFIGLSKNAILLHNSGHPTYKKFFGKTLITHNYRPEVRYYFARNKTWILRKYGHKFPRLIIPTLRQLITIPLKIALLEDESWEKLKLFVHGLVDGIADNMGPLRKRSLQEERAPTLQ